MKAMILAAGRGQRMRPLTDTIPKPLLCVGGKPLIIWHLEKLAAIGVRDVVINTSWLADRFPITLGDGHSWNLRLHYVDEGPTPLETGGGILHALPLLGDGNADNAAFIVINGDIWCDYDVGTLVRTPAGDAHLVLVDNPPHHPDGDFALDESGALSSGGSPMLTFSGIGKYRPSLFADWRDVIGNSVEDEQMTPRFELTPLLRAAMARGAITGERHPGQWTDVGTPQRLTELDTELSDHSGNGTGES